MATNVRPVPTAEPTEAPVVRVEPTALPVAVTTPVQGPASTPAPSQEGVSLDPQTRSDAASSFFGEENVPLNAVTMGVDTILAARKIIICQAW